MQLMDGDLAMRRDRLLVLLNNENEPFGRAMPEHITVSAVVHQMDTDTLLMIHHKKLQRWLFPGGHVEPELDLSLLAAAQRECLEETGLDPAAASVKSPLLLDIDIHEIPSNSREGSHSHFDVRYLFRIEACRSLVPGASWFARANVTVQFAGSIARPAQRISYFEHL
jgi:8-oxo-dGTP pyrophosphatase MutT (NUDIX family)